MPRALAQARSNRVDAVVHIAIGVHDGLLVSHARNRCMAINGSDRHGSELNEAEPELGEGLVRGAVRVKPAAEANWAGNWHACKLAR
ncbi:hypothetical protein D3C85_1521080 [compost metagenome]